MSFQRQDFFSAKGTVEHQRGIRRDRVGLGTGRGLCWLEYCLETSFPLGSELTFDPRDNSAEYVFSSVSRKNRVTKKFTDKYNQRVKCIYL